MKISEQFRAVSSGVEHCIHTAGVASSKLALPTNLLVIDQGLTLNRESFFVAGVLKCPKPLFQGIT